MKCEYTKEEVQAMVARAVAEVTTQPLTTPHSYVTLIERILLDVRECVYAGDNAGILYHLGRIEQTARECRERFPNPPITVFPLPVNVDDPALIQARGKSYIYGDYRKC